MASIASSFSTSTLTSITETEHNPSYDKLTRKRIDNPQKTMARNRNPCRNQVSRYTMGQYTTFFLFLVNSDGKPQHGRHIESIHLLPYESEEDFFTRLYDGPYSKLLHKAQEFVESTGATQDDVLVFISCGFDACEHEYPSMSIHNRKVPYYSPWMMGLLDPANSDGRVIFLPWQGNTIAGTTDTPADVEAEPKAPEEEI